MGRVIKLFIYFFAYQFLAGAIMIGGYMIANQTTDIPSAEQFMHDHLIWMQLLYALLLTAHLLGWKYVKRSDFSLSFPHTEKVLLTSVVFIIGMGCWTNYLTELTELPDRFADEFRMLMNHPIGIFSIVIMAPLMEELLVRGGMQGHLMRKWKNPLWAIVVSSLIFSKGTYPPKYFNKHSIQQAPQSFKSRCFTTSIFGILNSLHYYLLPLDTLFSLILREWAQIFRSVPSFDKFCTFFMLY